MCKNTTNKEPQIIVWMFMLPWYIQQIAKYEV